ncbi:MAG: hypothetical protein HGB17_16860, partial [Syntrophobacteraceae bacterium]|nr:hypothetical protein [Syntrophobacteraceae bacterium]
MVPPGCHKALRRRAIIQGRFAARVERPGILRVQCHFQLLQLRIDRGKIRQSRRRQNRIAMDVSVGDKVLYSKFAGTEVKLDGKRRCGPQPRSTAYSCTVFMPVAAGELEELRLAHRLPEEEALRGVAAQRRQV